jgi:uncharacterized protein
MKNKLNATFQGSFLAFITCMLISFGSNAFPTEKPDVNDPIQVLLLGGGDAHDFDKWYKEVDVNTLSKEDFAEVRYLDNMDSIPYYLKNADVLYMSNNKAIESPESRKAIMEFVDSGKGLVLGHAAMWYSWKDWPEFNRDIVSGGSGGHDRYGEFDVNIIDKNHPATQNVPEKFTLKDELYYQKVDPKGPGIDVLATASKEGSEVYPSVYVVKHPKSRIVGIALGHDGESHDLQAYQILLKNAIKWVNE